MCTLQRFDVEFSRKDCVTSKMACVSHITMYANSLFCSPAHSYTSVTKKERQNIDNNTISPRQTLSLPVTDKREKLLTKI